MNDRTERDPRLIAIPDTHGHAKGEHKPYAEERPLPLTARMLFLWFYHACRRGYPRFLMVADHMNYLTFEDPAAVNLVRRALKLAQAGDLYGAAETANVDVAHAAVVSEGLRRGMRYSIGAEVDNDPRSRPDAQNIVDAMRPDAIIRSVHFINITHPVYGENWPWPFDNPEFKDLFDVVGTEQTWELYVNALVDAIERLPGHIVGHFFVPAVFGHWPDDAKLSEYEDRVLAAAEARGMAVEFNSRFFYREHTDEEKDRYLDANKRFLRKAKERGVQIAIGSDAHSPKDQGGAFEVVLHVLDQLDINEIVFPMTGMLRRVALRVVREPDPEPEPAPEPPQPEPQKAAADHPAASDIAAAAEPAKPVRKARPSAKATRPPQTSPERQPERSESPANATEPPGDEPAAPDSPAPAASEPEAVPERAPAIDSSSGAEVAASQASDGGAPAAAAADTVEPTGAAQDAGPEVADEPVTEPSVAADPRVVPGPALDSEPVAALPPAEPERVASSAEEPVAASGEIAARNGAAAKRVRIRKSRAKPKPAGSTSEPPNEPPAVSATPAVTVAPRDVTPAVTAEPAPAKPARTGKAAAEKPEPAKGMAAAATVAVKVLAAAAKAVAAKPPAAPAKSAKSARPATAAKGLAPAKPAASAKSSKSAAATAKSAPKKAAPVKAGAKKHAPAKAAAKKAAPVRGAVKKAVPAKKAAAAKKAAPKKAAPARAAAKKAAPKKAAAKKAPPARTSPARKTFKKTTAKKTPAKRR